MGTAAIDTEVSADFSQFIKEKQDVIRASCDGINAEIDALLQKTEYSDEDINRIAQKLYNTNKLFILLYEFPMEYRNVLPRNILESMYLTHQTHSSSSSSLQRKLPNRSTPRFEYLAELLNLA